MITSWKIFESVDFTEALNKPGAKLMSISYLKEIRKYDRSNNKDELEKLEKDILKNGLLHPVEISIENNKPVLTKGNHRILIFEKLGYKNIPAIII